MKNDQNVPSQLFVPKGHRRNTALDSNKFLHLKNINRKEIINLE